MRLSFILLLTTILSSVCYGNSEQLQQAQDAYINKDYNTAINIYVDFLSHENGSSGVLYNLANAYQKTDQLAKAILNYEKALLLSPNNNDIIHNLRIVNDQIENPIIDVNNFFLSKWYLSIIHGFSSTSISYFLIFVVIIFLILVFFYLFKNINTIQLHRNKLAILLVSIIMFSYTVLRHRDNLENGSHTIVMKSSLFHSGADDRSETLQELDAGIKAAVLDSIGLWYKLHLPDKEQGWIKKENVAVIRI